MNPWLKIGYVTFISLTLAFIYVSPSLGGEKIKFLSAETCKQCHQREYKEWKKSFHSKSLTTPTFKAVATIFNYNVKAKPLKQRKRWGENLEYCITCHAPQTKIIGNYPELAEQILKGEKPSSEGITCTTCHSIKAAEDKPDPWIPVEFDPVSKLSYHNVKRGELFAKPKLCASCHDYNNIHPVDFEGDPSVVGIACCTVKRDWEKTSFVKKGISCQSCHMGSEIGVMKVSAWDRVKNRLFALTNLGRYVDDRKRFNHTMPGARSEEMLKKAVDLEIGSVRSGRKIKATVKIANKTGHSIPNGCPPRSRIYLRFWVEDKNGDSIYSGMREYGINFISPEGFQPVGTDRVAGRNEFPLLADKTKKELFTFELPQGSGEVELKATLTYVFFVTPPPEAKERMQKWIIKRIQSSGTQEEKDFILNNEIPDRMAALNTLESTFPPLIMAKASRTIALEE